MIKKVYIKPGCISCGNCEAVCPKIFKVEGQSQVVNHEYSEVVQDILQAEAMCPVNVIVAEKTSDEITLELSEAILFQKRELTHDVVELIFHVESFNCKPGQYVSLQMKDAEGDFTRSYSIADSSGSHFTLCVKIVENGRGGSFLTQLKNGARVSFLGPSGSFYLQDTSAPKVFIATGTGLAPMMEMLKRCPENIEKTVIFGVRNEKDLFYQNELQKYPNTRVISTISRASEAWHGAIGRVTDYLYDIPKNAEVYICGNPAMVDSVIEELDQQNHPSDNVFHEVFVDSSSQVSYTFFDRLKDIVFEGKLPGIEVMQILFFIAAALIPIRVYITGVTYWMWDLSWWAVTFVMLIRPLADLLPRLKVLRQMVAWRKGLGILSASVVVTSFFANMMPDFFGFWANYFTAKSWSFEGYQIFARVSTLTGIILLVTSNTFSQKTLGIWWKRIQRLAYAYFFCGGIYILSIGKTEALYSMIVVALAWVLAEVKVKLLK